ncbi:HAD family hydrolase [Bacterioplanes sanyensis]|nr:HAD family hydrolase [Bacterioplanes sanyensis]
MIKAVFFDLDNTLVDRSASIERFAAAFVGHYQSRLQHSKAKPIASLIKHIDNGGYLPAGSPYKKVYEAIGSELALQLDWIEPVSADELTAFWRGEFPKNTVEMEGAQRLLQQLHNDRYYLGIISNGAHDSRQATVNNTSFQPLIRELVSSGGFGCSKPDARIFLAAIAAAGLQPSQCMYVGDHPVNDIQGALAVGMQATWLQGYHPASESAAEVNTIKHLSELVGFL